MDKKPAEIEIPKAASAAIFRLALEDINKAIKTAYALKKTRITVTIRQE